LIQDPATSSNKERNGALTSVESFASTFGPGSQRKRPRLEGGMGTFEELAAKGWEQGEEEFLKQEELEAKANGKGMVTGETEIGARDPDLEPNSFTNEDGGFSALADAVGLNEPEPFSAPVVRGRSAPSYSKGQSRRIWAELYKVIDSSDVVIHVLDVRDPLGTRCTSVEKHIREEKPHKHLVYLLNKVDLVPTWVTVSFFLWQRKRWRADWIWLETSWALNRGVGESS